MKNHFSKFAAVAALVACAGCSAVKKQKECGELVRKASAAQQEIQALDSAASTDPAALRKMGEVCEKHAAVLAKTEISDPELKKHANAYAQMWRDLAANAREMADARKSNDLVSAVAALEKLKATQSKEVPLVAAMNKTCGRE